MAEIRAIAPEPEEEPGLEVDLDELSIGDLEDFEEIVGVSFEEAEAGNFRSIKALKALVFLTMRRKDPAFTIEDARNFKVKRLNIGTPEDPTDAAGSAS